MGVGEEGGARCRRAAAERARMPSRIGGQQEGGEREVRDDGGGGGDNGHQRTCHHATFNFCGYVSPGHKNSAVRRSICKDSYEPTSAKRKRSIFSYSRDNFGVGRRARSAPRRGTKIFVSGGKLGSPAKQRSRSISTRKRQVMERISVLSANTYLRTLSNAAPFQLRFWESNCHLLHQFLPRVPVGGIWNTYSVIGSLSHKGKLELF